MSKPIRLVFARFRAVLLLIAAATAAVAASAPAAAPAPRVLPQDLAAAMANRCLEHSKVGGWPPFSIAIVDAGGALLVFTRQDGASAATADAAILKARTSVRSGASTGELAAASKDPPTRDLLILLQLTDDPGGVPLVRLGNVLGAIGVSGGNAEQDTDCAKLAIAAFDKSLH